MADTPPLTPDLLLRAYQMGIFPMADSREATEVYWVDPNLRGILPLGGFHISRSLRRTLLRAPLTIRLNTDFEGTVQGCADREDTWINQTIYDLYLALHRAGFAHSLEVWEDGALVGGVYGVAIGGAFFGESMFSRRTDASKVALAYMVDRMRQQGFTLFDTQFITPHLATLGGQEIPRADYQTLLKQALEVEATLGSAPFPSPQELVQRSTQTS
ncbi:leucyl/phenylalanyl-tRNA--protein transferase [Alphaproteobacteria bacterium KMM 3653]|uniref:Leucyl/phenylalanyl-tRNA--protein transferase n=1 Tax=Harenicola maris TaxID=2841044 RepID=A0AAP2CKJ0_9RHOB|nr:leucyl/phenylalanyl-tRNA--protein transferase [Harenicola maris]